MKNKRLVNGLQNAALLLLIASALFLLLQTPLFPGGWSFFASPAASLAPQPAQEPEGDLSAMLGSIHIMVTADSEYGRFGQLYASGENALVQQVIPLFREALGSAAELEAATHQEFRGALEGAALYVDFTVQLPLPAVAACLGETAAFDRPVRSAALTAGSEAVTLYLRGEDDSLFRCATALPASAVEAVCAGVPPNGSSFAYETSYTALEPYTLLATQIQQPPELQADLPVGFTDYNLLTAVDFNAHTNSRYTDWDGSVVVEESPRTLRIGTDGTVAYSSAGTVSLPLFRVAGGVGEPDAADVLRTAWNLASALTGGTGAAPLYLSGMEETEAGCIVRFRYQAGGVPVCFPDESDALTVTVSDRTVTGFVYRCRSYTAAEEEGAPLLPPAMAAAIASLHPDSGLSVAYVDTGASRLPPCWMS